VNRKQFIFSATSIFLGLRGWTLDGLNDLEWMEQLIAKRKWRIPPYLKHGDMIGLLAPAGSISGEEVLPAKRILESWGFQVMLGETIGKKEYSFAGNDQERAKDLQNMLDAPEIKAILCARGGYGSIRILDALDFSYFEKHPKWLLGFSDITLLHAFINSHLQIASIHSKMCNSFPDNWEEADSERQQSILSIKKVLTGQKVEYQTAPHPLNIIGTSTGRILGGNLKVIESLIGSSTDLNTDHSLLFLEDTGEYLYNIDRMMWTLERAGKLKKLNGLIIGGFNTKLDDPGEEFGLSLQQIVLEKVSKYGYPVCFNFPVGHQPANIALKCGSMHELVVTAQSVQLKEI
jgi:muramoyltetrapeptide carboxypeptidase